jgi:CRISPR-associated endonuclease Csn1
MAKILGLDLGTNSIGLALRNTDNGDSIKDQLELFTSIIFKSGVGTAKTGEFSYAAERTKKRSARRLYQSRKYRIWATLELLIKEGYCPLTIEDLDKWRKYDKEKGLKRQYPIHAKEFEQWVRLDFNGDGVADYSSPYQLRAELMQKQFDFSNQTDRYKLGRALYHIAQHRGFKSSKGETISEQKQSEVGEEFDVTELKKSEIKKSGELVKIMQENNLLTVGCALYDLEKRGERIKASKYQAVRSQLKDEIIQIFKFQKGLDENSNLYKRIISEKKGEGTIFYKRPLRSQKGNVGKCTLEPNKPRCPISHPEFEEYRAWSFINNIKYRESENESSSWQTLSLELKQKLFKEKFLRVKTSFKFEEIRTFLEKELGIKLVCNKTTGTINYKDNTSVSACPVSARFKNLLGENYQQWTFESEKCRVNHKTGE